MKWLGYGWDGLPGPGTTVIANGQPIGTRTTLKALRRAGLVQEDANQRWTATQEGRAVTGQLCL